jgi:arsenite-transporting ATPase
VKQPRILLYTGKGGVGKTTLSAATALRCADLGYRTVVVSTDAAHSLADSFDQALGSEPTLVADRLYGQEIDLLYQMEKYWGKVREYLATVLAWRGMDDLIAEETAVLPGMEELASLLQIVYLTETGEYDVIIIDCAPTGATLQLLSFPDMARWYLKKIFPVEKKAIQLSRPFLRAVSDMPLPEDDLFDTIVELITRLGEMHDMLSDPQMSSIRLVLTPEKMVIREAQRAYTYLSLYNYTTDLVISNRVLPEEAATGYFEGWHEIQARYSQMVEEAFAPLPILQVPMFEQEVVGQALLRRLADAVYGDRDPTALFYAGQRQRVEREDGQYRLILPLPMTTKEAIHLGRFGEELVVHIGNHKRNILLPRALVTMDVLSARYEGDTLVITFAANGA